VSEDATMTTGDERELATDLVRRALAGTAPDELLLFEDIADQFFADPDSALSGDGRDEAVGFGLDLTMLTPAMLVVALTAIRMVGTMLTEAVKQEGTPVVRRVLRRLFGLDDPAAPSGAAAPAVQLSTDQLARVRETARRRALALGLGSDQAALLADAITGGLVTGA
jgi:hypothetical protein